ncbi:MAG TPA: antiterminator LoaP [Spirochaetales bacterium]|nr:antiterminator LoaP [Spirochaetales bacterium]
MEYFAIQVWTGKEDDFVRSLALAMGVGSGAFVPKRALSIRRRGKILREERPLFPGYVFLPCDSDTFPVDKRWAIRSINHFLRFLPDSLAPRPIKEHDRAVLSHFISFGKCADTSKVIFDENERIVVLEGPLKGLEGLIVRVDKRKHRAKVRLDMCRDSFLVDLGFEVMERPVKGSVDSDGKA